MYTRARAAVLPLRTVLCIHGHLTINNHFYFFQVLDGMLAQYGAVENCEQGNYAPAAQTAPVHSFRIISRQEAGGRQICWSPIKMVFLVPLVVVTSGVAQQSCPHIYHRSPSSPTVNTETETAVVNVRYGAKDQARL